ncbi:MAG TPA: hypothetical protein PKM88_14230, partial [bacterium]|nr:hypothetical protein [bacterium]
LLTYADRAIVMHSYFEVADARTRIIDFANRLFGSEDDFTVWADRYSATHLVYSADMGLADDGGSYRYLADRMTLAGTPGLPADGTFWRIADFAACCHFFPEALRHWQLVWQNHYYRVFRRAAAPATTAMLPDRRPALFDPDRARRYGMIATQPPAAFLRDAIAYDRAQRAAALLALQPATRAQAEFILRQAAQRFPTLSD